MESKLADYAEQQLIEAAKRMTPEQRLRAYIEHSKRMYELKQAGSASSGVLAAAPVREPKQSPE